MSAAPVLLGISLKMYFDQDRALAWFGRIAGIAARHPAIASGDVELVVLPSFPALPGALTTFAGSGVGVGAQNLFWEDEGAFTGEVSGRDLAGIGCRYVEIGHAERKRIFGETDEIIARKIAAALRNGLTPILCVGEPVETSITDAADSCIAQLAAALATVDEPRTIVVAYEPEWAIGAQVPASSQHIAGVCGAIGAWLRGHPLLSGSRVIYGGSAGPGLLSDIGHSVDGLFLGRFAHDPDAGAAMLDEAAALA
jgi:triosephosphate isomerase